MTEGNVAYEPRVSPEALAHLGEGHIAYVKQIRSEDVPGLFPQAPNLAPGTEAFRASRRRRHADHADRLARSRGRECLEQRAAGGERALSRSPIGACVDAPQARVSSARVLSLMGTAPAHFICGLPALSSRR